MSSKAQSAPKSLVIISSALVLVWIVLAAFPFFWTLWGSFKVQGDFFSKADWRYALTGTRTIIETGGAFTNNGYEGAWIQEAFWRNAFNTLIVVFFTVVISLTFGTLGGYALARSGHSYAFWAFNDCIGLSSNAAHHAGLRVSITIL
jgi:multiple sugar transport system permease protein